MKDIKILYFVGIMTFKLTFEELIKPNHLRWVGYKWLLSSKVGGHPRTLWKRDCEEAEIGGCQLESNSEDREDQDEF